MALFRSLGSDDVREILALYGLTYVGHTAIAVGTVNTNVKVETGEGTRFLRINEGKSVEDVAREAAIVEHVAARGVSTPAPFRTKEGGAFGTWQGQIVSLFPWRGGRTLPRSEVQPVHARAAGEALARLHLAGESFPDHRPGRYEPDEIDRRLARIQTVAGSDPALAAAVEALGPELDSLATARVTGLPQGLIHGDLFLDNVLYEQDRLAALLDFEQASWGRLAYDLAVTLLAFAFGREDFRPEMVEALLAGYVALRPVTPAERDGFGAELRFVACRFAVTRITDVYLKRAAGAAPGKDFRRYLLRLDRVKEHLAAGDRLLALP
ncbi:MAG TPA: homoserine kinase [Polyangia bacterium]